MKRASWEVPRLHSEEEYGHHRKVTWLELFYDLVFVVVVAKLAHHLTEHYDWAGLAAFALSFVPVWWVWISSTIYNERFETYGIENRLITFLLLCGVAALAIFSKDPLHKTATGFGLSYAAVRVVIIGLWVRAGYHVPEFRRISARLAVGFSLSVGLFVASVWAYDELRWAMWGLALFIDLVTPLTTGKLQRELPLTPRRNSLSASVCSRSSY
ncbi:MAG: low temperature requirement protein A [bacterium]|nr:low temperature requirement protein A [bacterium]